MSRFEANQPATEVGRETTPNSWNKAITRRQALGLIGFGSAAVFLAACGVGVSEATKSPDQLDPAGKLFRYLGNLPQSNLKDILINHASNYFTSPTPESVSLGGEEIKINNPSVVAKTHMEIGLKGGFSNREQLSPVLYTVENYDELVLPIPNLIREDEKSQVAEHLFPDGSLKAPVNFIKGDKVDITFSPTITITTPDPKFPGYDKDIILFTEQFIYIKEAATLLAFDLLVTEIAQNLKEHNLQKGLNVIGPDGKTIVVDVFPTMVTAALTNPQRLVAILDLAGYYFAFKAIKGSKLETQVRRDNPNFIRPFDAADNIPLGSNDNEILMGAINWALDNQDEWNLNDPNKSLLFHQGNLTMVP